MSKQNRYTAEELNELLYEMICFLHKHNFSNWFIAYGTLLGFARDNSCINGDDDVDIIMDTRDRARFEDLIYSQYSQFEKSRHVNILSKWAIIQLCKIPPPNTPQGPPIDVYFATITPQGDYYDNWEMVKWTSVTPFIERPWRDTILNMPRNYEDKLEKRYGNTWKTPIHTKKANRKISL